MDRRKFLEKGVFSLAAAGLLTQYPGKLFASSAGSLVNVPIGFQSFVLRDAIGKDTAGTLKKMAGFGYSQVEMCSPAGYVKFGFEPLSKYSGSELKKIIQDSGLSCISCHFTQPELRDNLDKSIEFAHQLGLKYMVLSFGLDAPALDDIKKNCAQMNGIGEKITKEGMIAGYHNHNGEFEHKIDNKPVYDIMLNELNPDLVKMQFQTAVITLGYKASDYFIKYPGRFISAHLSDYSPNDSKKQVVLGQGIIDWNEFFASINKGGLQAVFVEMESDPETLKDSATYLKNL